MIIPNVKLREARNIQWACPDAIKWMKTLPEDITIKDALLACNNPFWVTWFVRESIGKGVLNCDDVHAISFIMLDHSNKSDWGMTAQAYADLLTETMTNLRNILIPLIKED